RWRVRHHSSGGPRTQPRNFLQVVEFAPIDRGAYLILDHQHAPPPLLSPATDMTKPLAGRIALVTGGSRGIGFALSVALAQDGAHVVATGRTVGGLEELDDAIKAAGGTATLVPLELRDTDGIVRLAAALNERYGRLDILVGNAALGASNSPLDHFQPKE